MSLRRSTSLAERFTGAQAREALITGEVPEKFPSGAPDLAAAIAAAINPLVNTQLDEARVEPMIEDHLTTFEADGTKRIEVARSLARYGTSGGSTRCSRNP